jgi:hypothetical protein
MSRRNAAIILVCALFPIVFSLAQAQPKLQPRPGGGAPPPAQQQPAGGTIDSIPADMEAVLALVKQAPGYTNVEIVTGENNYKAVRAQYNGSTILAGPEICKDGVCRGLVFFSNLGKQSSVDLAWLNAWNSQKVFGRGYLDKDGNVVFDMTIHFWGGTTPRYITESADLYGVMLKALFEFQPGK